MSADCDDQVQISDGSLFVMMITQQSNHTILKIHSENTKPVR